MLAETPIAQARARAGAVRPPAAALVAASAISTQFGAAIATRLFPEVGPAGTVTLRLVFAAAALLAVVRPRPRTLRHASRADVVVVVGFGLALAAMNLSFYEAIDRVPLGVAVTLEFAGPLTLSVVTSRRWAHVLWALLAGAGVVLLAGGGLFGADHRLDLSGVGFALLAGAFWGVYILANKATGGRFPGASGLAWAMVVAAAVVTPLGAAEAGPRLLAPGVLGVGLAVAVLSSALPYSCEMAALRRVTPRAFGILLSMAPVLAALAGLVVLGQHLSPLEVSALALVVAANVGSSWAAPAPDTPLAAAPGPPRDRLDPAH
jgi:inner membrane transporter RhtA